MKKILFFIFLSVVLVWYFQPENDDFDDAVLRSNEKNSIDRPLDVPPREKEKLIVNKSKDFTVTPFVKDKLTIPIGNITPSDFDIETSFENQKYYNAFMESFHQNRYDEAIQFSENLLKLPDRYAENWWYGNMVHSVNIVLGKIHLSRGKIQKAEKYLLDSVAGKYVNLSKNKRFSPQLSTFGPDRSLAYDLYQAGRKKTVVEYFERTRTFWLSGVESGEIDKAINNIKGNDNEDDPHFPFMKWDAVFKLKKDNME